MKKTITGISIASLALLALAGGGAHKFTQYKQAPPARLHIPAKPDSASRENPFKVESLLDARRLHNALSLGWTTVTTDTAGMLKLVSPEDGAQLHTYSTRLRADRYAKGKLSLKSSSRASLKFDGKSVATKATADSTAVETTADVELLPQRSYEVTVDLLGLPEDAAAPEFSLQFIPDADFKDVAVESGPDIAKRVTPLSTMTGERTVKVSLSPDGKYLLTVTRQQYSANETVMRAQVLETATGNVIAQNVDSKAEWMAGENSLYFLLKRGEGYDCYKTQVPSMRTELMARNVPDGNVTVSPDGRYLFYYTPVEAAKQEGPMHRYTTPDSRIPGDLDRRYLTRYDLKTHVREALTYGGPTSYIYSMTHDGGKALLVSSVQRPDEYPFYFTDVVEMDMETLKCDTLIRNFSSTLYGAVYSPDGKSLFITSGPSAFDGIGANFAPHPIGNDYDGQGYIFDIATKKARAVTKDFNPAIEAGAVWNRADNKIYFTGEDGFERHIYALDPAKGSISELNTKVATVRGFSIGENDARYIAYVGGGFTYDGQAWLLNLKNGRAEMVADPLAEELDGVEFGKMEPWKFTSSDGTVVDGWMCLPPSFDPAKKYPLIVYYYGGTSPSTATFYHLYSPQVFASRDYVVYVLNPSGTTGYGQEFSARHVNAWGKRTADEIIEGTKLFCKAHPFVDDKKIGCIGASYGGFMTQYLQTKTDIFAAAVSHAGISNVTSYWGEGYWGYSYNSVAAAKSYPWTDPELYTKQGSLFNAEKIHTPLLLLHGTVDTNVPIGESIQLFNALKVLGRNVEFITVEGENHVISGFDEKQVWQNTIMAFFAKYLQDDPKWWNELYGK